MATDKERAFWHNEIHEWKVGGGNMSWTRWCSARDLNPDDMPKPLDPPATPAKAPAVPSTYEAKQAKRRKRAVKAIARVQKKETSK